MFLLGCAVIDEISEENADSDIKLKQDVQGSTNPRRSYLRQEQWDSLVSKSNAAAESKAAEDKHEETDSGGVKNGTDDEEHAGDEHGEFPTEDSGGVRSEESSG